MFGQSALGRSSDSRVFVYEVAGLRQNETNDQNDYQFRQGGNLMIKVSSARMNQEMQRINRMGGTIVSVHPFPCTGSSEE